LKSKDFPSKTPSDLFYEIIDKSENIEDTVLINQKLKDCEHNSLNLNNNHLNSISSDNSFKNNNIQLSDEDILYDEFNYLLEE